MDGIFCSRAYHLEMGRRKPQLESPVAKTHRHSKRRYPGPSSDSVPHSDWPRTFLYIFARAIGPTDHGLFK
ncbi:hypothetical protein D3C87_1696920 [compost metagenome]